MTAVFLAAGVVMTLYYPALMAGVITVSYSGLTQTFVGLFFAFFWKGCTKWGVGAGLLAGVIYLFLPVAAPYGLNKGIIAMAINVLASVLVSLLTQPDAETQGRFKSTNNSRKLLPRPASPRGPRGTGGPGGADT